MPSAHMIDRVFVLQLANEVSSTLRQQVDVLSDRLSTCNSAYATALEQLQDANSRNEGMQLRKES